MVTGVACSDRARGLVVGWSRACEPLRAVALPILGLVAGGGRSIEARGGPHSSVRPISSSPRLRDGPSQAALFPLLYLVCLQMF